MRFSKIINKLILSLLLFSSISQASATRIQEADSLISSNHLKTWTLPSITATLAGLAVAQTFSAQQTFSSSGVGINVTTNAQILGTLGIGGSPVTNAAIELTTNTVLATSSQYGLIGDQTYSTAATNATTMFSNPTTATSTSLTNLIHYQAANPTLGASSTAVRQVGFYNQTSTTATNNGGFSDNNTFTGNWFINQSGSAANTLGGTLTLGASGTALTVTNTAAIGTLTLTNALAVGQGGTGISSTPTNGQLLIGNGTNYTAATLGSGTGNVTYTSGSGSLSINVNIDSNQVQDIFYGNSSATTFTLSFTPPSANGLLCHLDGSALVQGSSNDYTLSTATVTMNTAPATGQRLLCYYSKY